MRLAHDALAPLDEWGDAKNNLKLLLNPIPDPIDDCLQSLKRETQATDEFLQEIKQDLQALKARGNVKPAMQVEVMSSLNDLAEGASAGGERLFFYYAGHGLASRISFANEDAIVSADYRKNVLKPISFSSIERFFQALPFPEQYIFLDCCRNLSISELDLDRAPPLSPDPTKPSPDQFVYYATAPGRWGSTLAGC